MSNYLAVLKLLLPSNILNKEMAANQMDEIRVCSEVQPEVKGFKAFPPLFRIDTATYEVEVEVLFRSHSYRQARNVVHSLRERLIRGGHIEASATESINIVTDAEIERHHAFS